MRVDSCRHSFLYLSWFPHTTAPRSRRAACIALAPGAGAARRGATHSDPRRAHPVPSQQPRPPSKEIARASQA
eukprot:6173466-Pleurochrysis_carterae.AAC.5